MAYGVDVHGDLDDEDDRDDGPFLPHRVAEPQLIITFILGDLALLWEETREFLGVDLLGMGRRYSRTPRRSLIHLLFLTAVGRHEEDAVEALALVTSVRTHP